MEDAIEKWDDRADEPEVIEIDDEEDDLDSLQVNLDRFPTDLSRLKQPAFCVDAESKVSRYLLFKLHTSQLITS